MKDQIRSDQMVLKKLVRFRLRLGAVLGVYLVLTRGFEVPRLEAAAAAPLLTILAAYVFWGGLWALARRRGLAR